MDLNSLIFFMLLRHNRQRSLQRDPGLLQASRLCNMRGEDVRELLGWKRDLPQQEERARLLREVQRVCVCLCVRVCVCVCWTKMLFAFK